MGGNQLFGAPSLVARAGMRRRRGALVLLAVGCALGFGFVLTVAAGARRTGTTFDRFRAATDAADVMVDAPGGDPLDVTRRLHDAPGVAAAAGFLYLPVAPDRPGVAATVNAGGFGALHEAFGTDVYRYRVLEGRRANPAAEDEITVNQELAELAGLRVGDRIDLVGYEGVMQAEATVVGINVGEFDLGANATNPSALFTVAFTERWLPVFLERFGGQISPNYLVRLDDASAPGEEAFRQWVRDQFGAGAVVFDGRLLSAQTSDALRVQTVALAVLAAVAALAAVFALGQAANRTLTAAADDVEALRAIGMTRRDRAVVVGLPAVVAVAGAGVLAVVVAILASGAMPIGFARRVEPSPGLRLDWMVVLPLAALLVIFVAGRAALGAWSIAALRSAPVARSSIPVPALPWVPATVGLRRALGGAGWASRTQSRSTLVGVLVAVSGVVAVVTFAASEDHLFATPRVHGWSFDAFASAADGDAQATEELLGQAQRSPVVAAYGSVFVSQALVGDIGADVYGFVGVRGDIHPPMVDGRVATSGDEVVLGTRLAESLGLGVGDRVEVALGSHQGPLTVSGIAVFPLLGNADFGYGVSVSEQAAAAFDVEWENQGVVARFRPGGDAHGVFEGPALGEVVEPYLPPSLLNLERAGNVLSLLGLFLALLGTAAVAHALVMTVRRSRREVAVMRCLGFVRRQVVASIAWQATAYVVVAAVLAVPVGVVIGRTAWFAVAAGLGVQTVAAVPAAALVGVVLVALTITNGAASVPAAIAARLHPAEVFRSE